MIGTSSVDKNNKVFKITLTERELRLVGRYVKLGVIGWRRVVSSGETGSTMGKELVAAESLDIMDAEKLQGQLCELDENGFFRGVEG